MQAMVNGRSTRPDVELILQKYPPDTWVENFKISYNEIGEIIETPTNTNRFKTVTNALRRRLFRQHEIVVGARDEKFYTLDASRRIEHSSKGVKSSLKKMRRMGQIAHSTKTDKLTDKEKHTRNYITTLAGTIHLANATERKKLNFQN